MAGPRSWDKILVIRFLFTVRAQRKNVMNNLRTSGSVLSLGTCYFCNL